MKRILRIQPAVQMLAGCPQARLSAPLASHIASRTASRQCSPVIPQARLFSCSRRLAEEPKKDTEEAQEAASTDAAPAEATPTEAASAEVTPSEAAPAEATPIEAASAEVAPSEADSTYTNPIDSILDDAIAKDSSAKASATEDTTEGAAAAAQKDDAAFTITKIPTGESTAYSEKRSEMFTKTRPPSKIVSVQPNPAECEKFTFPLLRRPRRIANKEAIISGGASGIGFAIAQRLAAEGVQCTLVGRTEERLRKAAETLPPLSASANMSETDTITKQHKYFVADICDPQAWRDLFQQSPNTNYLINAAGITYRSLLAIFPADEIQRIYDVNLYGTTIGCRAALRSWARSHKAHGLPSEKPDRCIVNVSSALATQGGYGAAAYAASKAGVVALTRSLSLEAASRSIRCNVVLPGYIQTRMTESLLSQETLRKIAVKRLGRPDEVADAVTFLIKNKYANNCELNLDGGLFI